MRSQQSSLMKVAPLLLLFSLNIRPVLGGVACFAACAIACCEVGAFAFAEPLDIEVGITGCFDVCLVACASLVWAPPACFAGDTSIATLVSVPSTKNSTSVLNIPISEVHVGDDVLTLIDGKHRTTRIIHNIHSKGEFEFLEFELIRADLAELDGGRVTSTRKIKVTPQHSMLVTDPFKGDMRFSIAEHVKVGDLMKTSDGSSWKVSNISRSMGEERYTLVTSEGSVLASGVLVSTVCEEEMRSEQALDDVMDAWKVKHRYGMYTKQSLASSRLMGA
ncbi:hypothetical protein B0H34DRAFT_680314 [Crassisporium funariophilum]|nr:hypothetical protein B0H34DRAFT_680314 [Crassisporium funariophilum]